MNMKQTPSSARALCRFLIIFAALTHPRHCDALGVKTLISTIGKKVVLVSIETVEVLLVRSSR